MLGCTAACRNCTSSSLVSREGSLGVVVGWLGGAAVIAASVLLALSSLTDGWWSGGGERVSKSCSVDT